MLILRSDRVGDVFTVASVGLPTLQRERPRMSAVFAFTKLKCRWKRIGFLSPTARFPVSPMQAICVVVVLLFDEWNVDSASSAAPLVLHALICCDSHLVLCI